MRERAELPILLITALALSRNRKALYTPRNHGFLSSADCFLSDTGGLHKNISQKVKVIHSNAAVKFSAVLINLAQTELKLTKL